MATSNNMIEIQNMGQTTELQFASFENAKRQLKSFSNRNSGDFGIDKVEVDGGFFRLGDHKVTGSELNRVTSQVQDYLIKVNGFSKDVVKEIGHVYDALESLDKEYIPAILTAVKGAEIASNQAKKASEHARVAQEDIEETIQKQKKIVGVLEKHKEKLDKLVHLENIDDIWKQSKDLEKELSEFQKSFQEAKEQLTNFEKSIKSLQSFANSILDYEHLEEIDDIWERLGDAESHINSSLECITETNKRIDEILQISHIDDLDYMWDELINRKKDIDVLEGKIQAEQEKIGLAEQDIQIFWKFKKKLDGLNHVSDIDESWSDLQDAKKSISDADRKISKSEQDIQSLSNTVDELRIYKQDLSKLVHLFDVDKLDSDLIQANQEIARLISENNKQQEMIQNLQSNFEENEKRNEVNNVAISGKIKRAYIIAGSAMGLTIIQLILIIVGVL